MPTEKRQRIERAARSLLSGFAAPSTYESRDRAVAAAAQKLLELSLTTSDEGATAVAVRLLGFAKWLAEGELPEGVSAHVWAASESFANTATDSMRDQIVQAAIESLKVPGSSLHFEAQFHDRSGSGIYDPVQETAWIEYGIFTQADYDEMIDVAAHIFVLGD
jgi:hypothetical protein